MTETERKAREQVVQAGHKLVQCGLVARTWGNISARISDTHFVITPSGLAYEHLTPDKLVRVRIADCAYEGDRKPSSEKGIHAAVYRHKPQTGFVVHTHQEYASCVGVAGRDLTDLAHPVLGDTVPCASYGMPSTKKLQKGVETAMLQNPSAKAILMKHHGALCMAPDFDGAFEVALALEAVCGSMLSQVISLPETILPGTDTLLRKLQAKSALCYCAETDPAVQAVAAWGKTLHPHLDDLAQIAGVTIRCVQGNPEAILKGLSGRNAVLVKGIGAVCCARDPDDLAAIAAILRKSCRTALYAASCGATPLSVVDRQIMRLVYTMKYAGKKTEK